MNKESIYKRSLELAREDVLNTPKDVLEEEIKSYRNSEIEGPTFDEYLDILQRELQASLLVNSVYEYIKYEASDILIYNFPNALYYQVPIPPRNMNKSKKGSELMSEFFF